MKYPLVSLIITTKNEEEVLETLLESVNYQTYKNVELIVVDNKSKDKTKEIAFRHTKNVYDFGPERSAQRNFGAAKARGEYLLILDADMGLSKNVIKECVSKMESDEDVGALSILETSVSKTFWEKVKAFERSFYNLEGDRTTDAARFFRKKLFLKVSGYDESITGPEDWDLTDKILKLGKKIETINAKIKHYERVPNPFKLARKKYYYGLKSYRYLNKHNVSPLSSKTIYFLRPVFYKNWKKIIKNPILSLSMFAMLIIEQIGGGLGYLVGKYKKL